MEVPRGFLPSVEVVPRCVPPAGGVWRRHFLEKDLFYFLFNIDIVYYLLFFFVLKAPYFLFGI